MPPPHAGQLRAPFSQLSHPKTSEQSNAIASCSGQSCQTQKPPYNRYCALGIQVALPYIYSHSISTCTALTFHSKKPTLHPTAHCVATSQSPRRPAPFQHLRGQPRSGIKASSGCPKFRLRFHSLRRLKQMLQYCSLPKLQPSGYTGNSAHK